MPKPGLLDLHRVAKGMNMYDVFEGIEGNNRHATLHRVKLRWGNWFSGCWQNGSMCFYNAHMHLKNHHALPKAIWLCMDMLHLIMLLAKRTI